MNPLESIENEIAELVVERVNIDRKLAVLKDAKKVLEQVYGQPLKPIPSIEQFVEAADVGITDAVRGAFRLNAIHNLTPLQVRDVMTVHGFNLSKYTNAMAVIHQVISRLLDAQEIEGPFQQGNEKTYKWKGKAHRVALTDQIQVSDIKLHPAYMPASTDPMTAPPVNRPIVVGDLQSGPVGLLIEESQRKAERMRKEKK